MFAKIAKLLAYKRAPVRTFVAAHPIRAAKMGLSYLVVKKVVE